MKVRTQSIPPPLGLKRSLQHKKCPKIIESAYWMIKIYLGINSSGLNLNLTRIYFQLSLCLELELLLESSFWFVKFLFINARKDNKWKLLLYQSLVLQKPLYFEHDYDFDLFFVKYAIFIHLLYAIRNN